MTPLPAVPISTAPIPDEVQVGRSKEAWKEFGRKLLSITPARLVRILMVLGALIGLIWLVSASWPALVPFLAGGVLAYVVLPLVNMLDRVLPRVLAALISVLFVLACIGAILWVIIPPLVSQTVALVHQIPPDTTIQDLSDILIVKVQELPPSVRNMLENLIVNASNNLRDNVNTIFPTLISINAIMQLINAIGFILGLIVLPTWVLTVLKSTPGARRSLDGMLPVGVRADVWAIVRIMDRSFGIFLRGQVLISLAVGGLTYIGLKLLTFIGAPEGPYPVTFAVIAALLQLIPDIGPLVNIVGIGLLAYRVEPRLALYVVVLYLGIQYLVSRLLKDRIEERIIDVNPALLVVFIVALGQLSFLWLFLAAPLAGLSRDLFRYVYGRLGEPPRPAGLLPDEPLPQPASTRAIGTASQRTPMIYRRMAARGNSPSSRSRF